MVRSSSGVVNRAGGRVSDGGKVLRSDRLALVIQGWPCCVRSAGRGGMPMNSGLTSALSAFSRRSSAFSKNPFAAEPNEPPLHPTELTPIRKARWWLGKVVPFAFVRFLTIFFIGVVTTLAWQFYGSGAREAIAGWSPHLGWLAPPPAPSGADR